MSRLSGEWYEDFGGVSPNITGVFAKCWEGWFGSFAELSDSILAIFGAGLGSFDELSGGILAFFGAGLGSLDELSDGVLAFFGAGLGSFDELPGRFLVAIGE